MAETSNYLRTRILDHVLNTAQLGQTQLFLALSTTALTASSTGSTIGEPTWPAYARVAISFNAANLSGPAGAGRAGSNAQIDFNNDSGVATNIVSVALVNNLTVGTGDIYYFDLNFSAVNVADGGILRFEIDGVAPTQA